MADEFWDIKQVREEMLRVGPATYVTEAGARSAMARAKIRATYRYPAQLVRDHLAKRKGQGHRTDLEES